MKLKFALAGLVAIGGIAVLTGTASAVPLAPFEHSQISNVEKAAVVCGPRGCVRTAPVYRGYRAYGVRRYGVRRGYGYGYHRGYRRW